MVDEANKPIILALGLGDEEQKYLTTNVWDGLLTKLQAKASLKRATTTQEAESLMDQYPKLRGILITDPGIITTENKPVTQRVIRYVEAGGTAIFGAVFSSLIRPPDFDQYFEESWSLSWKAGSYYRTTVILNRSSHGLPEFDLPGSYSQKAVYVKNVPRTSTWYLGEDESDTAGDSVTDTIEAPVVFLKVGEGWLGYTGDVNAEEGTTAVVLGMFGLPPYPLITEPKSSLVVAAEQGAIESNSGTTRYASAIESWGSRENFQLSYGLKMTPDDMKEGDAIIEALIRNNEEAEQSG